MKSRSEMYRETVNGFIWAAVSFTAAAGVAFFQIVRLANNQTSFSSTSNVLMLGVSLMLGINGVVSLTKGLVRLARQAYNQPGSWRA